jgi:copper homeostasis protein CutC
MSSDCQAVPALGATGTDHGATTAGRHTDEETMGALAADDRRLISAFHEKTLEIVANWIAD